MANGTSSAERRQARRINVDLQVRIAKTAPVKRGRLGIEWVDMADLKNISHLGAYFEYRGHERLNSDDILRIDLDVSFPFENKDITVNEHLPLGGLASVVRTQRNPRDASIGVGVKFLEPLSMINSA